MDPSLEELKKQRALLAQHLAWLDAQIANRSTSESAPITPPLIPPTAAIVPLRHLTGSVGKRDISPLSSDTLPELPGIPTLHAPSGLEARQRWGCIALAVIVSLGTVLVFWVLPQFIY